MKHNDIKMRNIREEVRGIENTLKRPCMHFIGISEERQWGRSIIGKGNS